MVLGLTCEPPRAGGDGEVAVPRLGQTVPGPASDAAPSPRGLQGGWEAGAWLVSCGECPAKVSAINKSIIKGGYTLALEHAPGRAYFRPLGKRVRGGEVRGCKGPRSAGGRGGFGAGFLVGRMGLRCRMRDVGKEDGWGTHVGSWRRGMKAVV